MRACDPPSLQIALSWGWHSSNTSTETIASVTLGRRTVLASVFEGGFSGPFGVLLPNAPPRRCAEAFVHGPQGRCEPEDWRFSQLIPADPRV